MTKGKTFLIYAHYTKLCPKLLYNVYVQYIHTLYISVLARIFYKTVGVCQLLLLATKN